MKSSAPWIFALWLIFSSNSGLTQETAEDFFNKGMAAVKAGQLQEAIQSFEATLALQPDHGPSYRHIGLVYTMKAMWNEAIVAYRKAIEIDPENPESHYDLGFCLYKQEKLDEAIEEFKTAIALNAEFVSAYQALGGVYAQKNMVETALIQFKKALELSPNDRAVHWNLAEAYSELGKDVLAADHYYHVGVLSLQGGDREGALTAYEKALPLSSEIAGILLSRLYPEKEAQRKKRRRSSVVIGPSPSRSGKPWYRVLTNMNVRNGPSLKSDLVGKIEKNGTFQIIEESPGNDSVTAWYRVKGKSGVQGWLCGIYKGVIQYTPSQGPE